ncbi:MAG: hypothetical protein IT168_09385 [Bryobacterales bacterium]|nr:hypothetical protein [Bryobacterales bacterium]
MRHEASFLKDILAAGKKIEAITSATTDERFLRDEILPAINRLSPATILLMRPQGASLKLLSLIARNGSKRSPDALAPTESPS